MPGGPLARPDGSGGAAPPRRGRPSGIGRRCPALLARRVPGGALGLHKGRIREDHLGMKGPANITADRLMLDYLARVAAAGTWYLPKGDRMAFVGKTRRRIERECGTGLGDPECMRGVLARLGEPEELVMAERARIDAARIRRKDAEAGAAAAESIAAPLQHRRINSRLRPATHAWPIRQPGDADARPGRPSGTGRRPARGGIMRDRLAGLLGEWPGTRRRTPSRGPAGPATGSERVGPAAGSGPAAPDVAGRDTPGTAGPAESAFGQALAAAPAHRLDHIGHLPVLL